MAQQDFYKVWHMRADEQGQDHDKLLGIYSSWEKAEQALAGVRVKPGFRDYPDGFELYEAALDETCFTDGFVSLWGDEEPDDEAMPRPPVRLVLKGYNEDGRSDDVLREYYVLWIRFVHEDGYDHELTPGTYTTRENAERARAFLSDKPGFCDHPDGIEITEGVIDKTYFPHGFIAMDGPRARDVEITPAEQTSHQ